MLERTILNVTDSADRWVAGYAGVITTPEETYALQVRKVDLTKLPYISEDSNVGFVMCALWAHIPTGMESVATWWCKASEVAFHVGALLQQEVSVSWRQ